MGTKVHSKSYLPGFHSMRDLNEDSSSGSWPFFYGDKTIPNGQYYNGFMPRASIDGYPGHDKDALKQKMLDHEAVFKNQVCELHRLYGIQRDMMEEVKRKEVHKHRDSMEPASSSSLRGSQVRFEDARKWHMAGFPLSNSSYGRTISGVEVVNSPMSCTKENTTQPVQFPFQNGSTSKDFETLDPRPFKVRKKLFDLQLPADTEEGGDMHENKEINLSSYAPNGNFNYGPENNMKLFFGGHAGKKTDCATDASASTSASCLRGFIDLADLNEPVQIEDGEAPSCVDLLGHTLENVKTEGIDQLAKSKAGYFGVTRETVHLHDGFLTNSSTESKVTEKGQASYMQKGESARGNLNSATQSRQADKLPLPSHPVQGLLNQVHHPQGIYPSGYIREDHWRERIQHGLESSDRSRDHSNNSHFGPIASQTPNSYPFYSSSSFASSWAHSVSSWAKPRSDFAQKVNTLETPLSPTASMSRNSERGHINATSRLNPFLGSESRSNGFYQSSASGSQELQVRLPSAGFEYLNCSRGDNVTSDQSNFQKGSCHANPKPAVIDINLNEVISRSPSNEIEIKQDLNLTDGKNKPEDHLSALPWLKPKPVHVNEFGNTRRSEPSGKLSYLCASPDQLRSKNETVRDLNQPFTSKAMLISESEVARKKEIAEPQTIKKILGFPIFERNVAENEPELKKVVHERKNRVIDINVACEPDELADEELTVEKEKEKTVTSIRDHIDLNSCVSDCEDPPAPCYERTSNTIKITLEIDLEVPVLMESEDDSTLSKENIPEHVPLQITLENKNDQIQDEVLKNAAETIVAISSSCPQIPTDEASLAEALLWFVDSLSSHTNELENTSGFGKELRVRDWSMQQASCKEMDDFEAMTLQLEETKEEDYMPKPFIPEFQNLEGTGTNSLPSRPRRGQSRRGRQRRDFQRDILPGLASLSRHEVTEDLQTFGGLMRATGHSWNSGLTRRNGTRNGGGRGRRRVVVETVPLATPLMQQLNHIEGGLEDRSLTGWGKTTRRPRRQRCPAGNGNPPTVVLM